MNVYLKDLAKRIFLLYNIFSTFVNVLCLISCTHVCTYDIFWSFQHSTSTTVRTYLIRCQRFVVRISVGVEIYIRGNKAEDLFRIYVA